MPRRRLTLTAAHVESLPALEGQRTEYADTIVPELVLRVSPDGARRWSVRFGQGRGRGARRTVRVTLGPTSRYGLAAARIEARNILERVSRGEAPQAEAGFTVERMVERGLEALDLRPSTRKEWGRLARAEILPVFGKRRPDEIQRADVRQWTRDIGRRSTWTANRAFELLRRLYTWARREELAERSPCDFLERPFPEPSSERVLSRDELRRLLAAFDRLLADDAGPWVDVARLLLLTGVRRGAVLGMRRDELEDLDGDEPRWVVPAERSKSGRAHVVPLSPAAVRAVRRRLEAVGPALHLFPLGGLREQRFAGRDEPMGWSSKWPAALCEEMRAVTDEGELAEPDPRWTIHNLRQTIATHLVEDLGTRRDVVSLILGHTLQGPRVTRVYTRAEELPARRAALERWAEWLKRLADENRPAKVLPMKRR